ncbi:MAG: AMP-binding protein [Bacteroidota bacterium]
MITEKTNYTFPSLFSETLQKFPTHNAYAFVGSKPITYRQADSNIKALQAFLEKLGAQRGDKVAILSSNMPNWGITYFATTFMGAVAVPLLPDFHSMEIEKFVEHSEAKFLFVSKNLRYKLKGIEHKMPSNIIMIDDFALLRPLGQTESYDAKAIPQKEYHVAEDDLAAIIYTSGTTGKPKGVMLSHKNIAFTAIKAAKIQFIDEKDRFLSILPLSHTYENTLGLILPMIYGACVYYLDKPPTPAILLPAMKLVRPTLMLTVPLIIEKIYRNTILPTFTRTWIPRVMYKTAFVHNVLNWLAGRKLKKSFGGKLKFFGIGGAKLDKKVEKFLIEARFPYAIGYGLTETAPLLAGCSPHHTKLQSTGPKLDGIELKIMNPDPVTGEGEIVARGPNVMLGYYKEPELTAAVIDEDGWFKTGDLGMFGRNDFLYIRGRLKNMIVMQSGENVYPEEIENVINNFRYVDESLVVEQKGKLVALVYFNKEEIAKKYTEMKTELSIYVDQKIEELKVELEEYVNKRVNKFSRLQSVIPQDEDFKKTATQKIKRFLYTK